MRFHTGASSGGCMVAITSLFLAGCQTLERNGPAEAAVPAAAAVTRTNTRTIMAPGPGPKRMAASTEMLAVNTVPGSQNPASLVLKKGYADHRAILSGDAADATEQEVIHHYAPRPHASLLEASHYGAESEESNNATRAAATSPSKPIVIAGPSGLTAMRGAMQLHATRPPWCSRRCTSRWVNAMIVRTFQGGRAPSNSGDDDSLTVAIGNPALAATSIGSPSRS